MLCYYVIGGDGRRYGPADETTLVQWVRQGRIARTTAIIDAESGRRMTAESHAALARLFDPTPVRQDGGDYARAGAPRGRSPASDRPAAYRPAADRPGADRPAADNWAGPDQGSPRVHVMPGSHRPEPVRVRRDMPPRWSADERPGTKNKVAAGLLAILLPGLGLHRFYLGFPGIAILQILTLPLCGIGAVWGFVEGILCLTGSMRDADGRRLRD